MFSPSPSEVTCFSLSVPFAPDSGGIALNAELRTNLRTRAFLGLSSKNSSQLSVFRFSAARGPQTRPGCGLLSTCLLELQMGSGRLLLSVCQYSGEQRGVLPTGLRFAAMVSWQSSSLFIGLPRRQSSLCSAGWDLKWSRELKPHRASLTRKGKN